MILVFKEKSSRSNILLMLKVYLNECFHFYLLGKQKG